MLTTGGEFDPLAIQQFLQLWMKAISLVLGQIVGKDFPLAPGEASPRPVQSDAGLYLTIVTSGAARGELSLYIPTHGAAALAAMFMGQGESVSNELTSDDHAAVEELFRQIAGHVCTAAKPIFQELAITVTLGQAPTWPPAASGWVESSATAAQKIELQWQASAALNNSLSTCLRERQTEKLASRSPAAVDSIGSDTLDFFMDMELQVTLRLGGKDILLKDVLALGPGSVFELDRKIQDPADLLLDGRLIARGEVVMVNGNYGLKVTEVCTHSQLSA